MSTRLDFGHTSFRESPRVVPLTEYRQRRQRQAVGSQSWASLNRREARRVSAAVYRGTAVAIGIMVVLALAVHFLGQIAAWLAS